MDRYRNAYLGGGDISGGIATSILYRYSPTNPAPNIWKENYTSPIYGRYKPNPVWTGTEMIVWGGFIVGRFVNNGARYKPATDTWDTIATNPAFDSLANVLAVFWTGNRMIAIGSKLINGTYTHIGRKFNPAKNTWEAISMANAPAIYADCAYTWTGTELLIFGGSNGSAFVNTTASYNPQTNTWTTLTNTNAPTPRGDANAVWTGNMMIIWSGKNNNQQPLNSGGRYVFANQRKDGSVIPNLITKR